MKKLTMLIFIFLSITRTTLNAQDFHFGWNVGNVNIFYNNIDETSYNIDVNMGQFYLTKNRFSIGSNILGFYNVLDKNANKYVILPFELAFHPLNLDYSMFFSIYGKMGWELTKHTNDNKFYNGLFSSVGVKFLLFPEIAYHYSFYFSVFAEYNIHRLFKVGVSIDMVALAVLVLGMLSVSASDRYEQKYSTIWRKNRNP